MIQVMLRLFILEILHLTPGWRAEGWRLEALNKIIGDAGIKSEEIGYQQFRRTLAYVLRISL